MKNRFKILLAALALCAFALSSTAQVSPFNLQLFTNLPPNLTNGTAASPATGTNLPNIFLLTRDCDLSVSGQLFTTNNFNYTNGTVTIGGSFSNDGTNFGILPFVITSPTNTIASNSIAAYAAGSNNVCNIWTNWSHTYIAGLVAVEFLNFTNTSTNCVVFFNTNSLKINRPTINTLTF